MQMALTKAMDLRYLWVERLCIIQDDSYHVKNQIQQMASIFANSYFTIIAADGSDANYGLRGIDSESSPRNYKESTFKFSESMQMAPEAELESIRYPKVWHTRGWTFQERAVSQRALIFTNETVYWQCRRRTWHESRASEPDGTLPLPHWVESTEASSGWPSYALTIHPWPDLERYFNLVEGYNKRNLSFESDALTHSPRSPLR